jgi:hypothetical protein
MNGAPVNSAAEANAPPQTNSRRLILPNALLFDMAHAHFLPDLATIQVSSTDRW